MSTTLLLLTALAAPPINSPPQAVARLRAAKGSAMKAAVKDVSAACRGKLRHSLRDHPALIGEAKRIATTGTNVERKAALDLFRCFTPPKMLALLEPNLEGDDPEMITFAAEVAARLEAAEMVAPLLAAQAKKKSACLKPGLSKPDVEVCVWLIYAPGAGLTAADAVTKKAAGDAAVLMFVSPYPKVREVAVETAAATKMKTYAPAVKKLIADEKGGVFEAKNEAALLGRFKKRYRALSSGK